MRPARILTLFVLLFAGAASADPRVGLNGGACQFDTIGEAIDAASRGDEVMISAGLYTEFPGNVDTSLTFTSATADCGSPSNFQAVVDGLGGNARLFHVFSADGPRTSVTFNRITLKHSNFAGQGGLLYVRDSDVLMTNSGVGLGSSNQDGGCISAVNSTLALTDSVVSECVAGKDGGAIALTDSVLTAVDSQITDSVAEDAAGGAIAAVNSRIELQNSDLTDNYSKWNGGAVSLRGDDAELDITNGNVSGNGTDTTVDESGGGAIFVRNAAALSARGTRFTQNAAYRGAAIWMSDETQAELRGCEFVENSAGFGGAIAVLGGSTSLTVHDCMFEGNFGRFGGAIYSVNGDVDISESRFQENRGAFRGGSLYVEDADVVIRDSAFIGNVAYLMNNGRGGALSVRHDDAVAQKAVEISGTTFSENSSVVAGGAIEIVGNPLHPKDLLTINDSTFHGNNSGERGGAIAAAFALNLIFTDVIFNSNELTDSDPGSYGAGVYATEDVDLFLTRTEFVNNLGPHAGGALAVRDDSTLIMRGGFLDGNGAANGAGLYVYDSVVLLEDLSVRDNEATSLLGTGGGLHLRETNFTLRGLNLSGNSARNGGAVNAHTATGLIENTRFVDNVATKLGGALRLLDSAITVRSVYTGTRACETSALAANTYCTEFRNNESGEQGGAAYVQAGTTNGSTLTMDGVALIGSRAVDLGSAISVAPGADADPNRLTVTNALISGSGPAFAAHEAIFLDQGVEASLQNTTIVDGAASAITADGPDVTLELINTLLWNNADGSRVAVSDTSVTASCAYSELEAPGSWNLGENVDPEFLTDPQRGDYRLDPSRSPMVDVCLTGPADDLDGNGRPAGSMSEPGAFEVAADPVTLFQVVTSGSVTTSETGAESGFTVALAKPPLGEVVIPVASSDETEGLVDVDALRFMPENWNQPQQVTVFGVDDVVVDGTQFYQIILGPSVSYDSAYAGAQAGNVAAQNLDDDTTVPTDLIFENGFDL